MKRIAEQGPMVHVDDGAERAKLGIGRPGRVEDFRKRVVEILQEKPDLASLEILRRVREAGYQGGKTALYPLVASLRAKQVKPLVRFEDLPGLAVSLCNLQTAEHFLCSPLINHCVET